MFCTFGALGAMDFGHKKHKVEGGGVQHATYEKKMLHALGALGLGSSRF
jgi:hypothetical protein